MVGLFVVDVPRRAGDAEPGKGADRFLGEAFPWTGDSSGDREGKEVKDFAEVGPGVVMEGLRDRTRTVPGR